jgi:hypothetical protein
VLDVSAVRIWHVKKLHSSEHGFAPRHIFKLLSHVRKSCVAMEWHLEYHALYGVDSVFVWLISVARRRLRHTWRDTGHCTGWGLAGWS